MVKKPRGTKGSLKRIVEMPLDTVCEIFGYLSPLDLWHIAQGDKALRRIMMDRRNAFVWRNARKTIHGLPECPPDLSEPQYAALCFAKHCMECMRGVQTYHIWGARVRLCKKCIELKCQRDISSYRWIVRDYERQYVPFVMVTTKTGSVRYYYTATLIELEQAVQTRKMRETIFPAIMKSKQDNITHGHKCLIWYAGYQEDQARQKALEISEYWEQVLLRAHLQGYRQEIERDRDYCLEKLKDSALISRAYERGPLGKNFEISIEICGRICDIMDGIRAHYKEQEERKVMPDRALLLEAAYRDFCAMSPMTPYPPVDDFCEMPMVKGLVHYTPTSEVMTKQSFEPAFSVFSVLIEQWRRARVKYLADLVRAASAADQILPDAHTDILDLATSWFYCTYCYDVMRPARAMMHANAHIRQDVFNVLYDRAITSQCITMIGDIVEICGFNRNTAKLAELDSANPVVECISCQDEDRGRCVMSWSAAVYHWKSTHFVSNYDKIIGRKDKDQMRLRLLNEQETTIVRPCLAQKQEWERAHNISSICTTCGNKGSIPVLERHWVTRHGRPPVDGDILPHPDYNHDVSKICYLNL